MAVVALEALVDLIDGQSGLKPDAAAAVSHLEVFPVSAELAYNPFAEGLPRKRCAAGAEGHAYLELVGGVKHTPHLFHGSGSYHGLRADFKIRCIAGIYLADKAVVEHLLTIQYQP